MIENIEPKVRELKRTELRWEQKRHRKAEIDVNRAGLGEMLQEVHEIENLSSQEIKGLASRIKRRKHADAKDLIKLGYGFQQSGENISEFVRITGAINVIVKEFTGHDSDLQQLAGECLCNLSLGDEVCCEKVATFAGTYLIAFLENVNNRRLNGTCIWTLQNIISSGLKAVKVLNTQGVIPSLFHLLENIEDQELLAEILLALELLLDYELLFISKEHILTSMLPTLTPKKPQLASLKVLYKSLVLTNFETLDVNTPEDIILHCVECLASIISSKDYTNTCAEVVLSVRVLANLAAASDHCCAILMRECQQHQVKLSDLFNQYSEAGCNEVCREMLWLLGNVYKSSEKRQVEQYLELDNFIGKLMVPKVLLA